MQRLVDKNDWPIAALAVIKVLLCLGASFFDQFFRDEFYYIACSRHLDWGYVDHPPLIAYITFLSRQLLGESLLAYRFFPALTGGLIVFFSARLTGELGGNRFAQQLTGMAVLISPIFLATHSFLSMNVFDHGFWLLGIYMLVKAVKTGSSFYWLAFGALAGVGLLNKLSILFLGFGVFLGLLLTGKRTWFATPWPWLAGALALLIFLPHLLWQVAYGWPTLEFIHNATQFKNVSLPPIDFVLEQWLQLHPLLIPLWLLGLGWLFFSQAGKPFRFLGWAFLAIEAVVMLKSGKTYYLAPANLILLCAGSAWLGSWLEQANRPWVKGALLGGLALGGAVTAPMAMPLLPVEWYPAYFQRLGVKPAHHETSEVGALPQHLADRYGWPELAQAVLDAYHALSPQEQAQCIVVAGNYGQAGAIEFYGAPRGLPPVLCGHNSYHLWGPGERAGEIAIVVGFTKEQVQEAYEQVKVAAVTGHPYAMPEERNQTIYLCRQPKQSIQACWPALKNFI